MAAVARRSFILLHLNKCSLLPSAAAAAQSSSSNVAPTPLSPLLSNAAFSHCLRYSGKPAATFSSSSFQYPRPEKHGLAVVAHSSPGSGGGGGRSSGNDVTGGGGGGGYGRDPNIIFYFLAMLLMFTDMDKDLVLGFLLAILTVSWQGVGIEMGAFVKAVAMLLLVSRLDLDSPRERSIVLISVTTIYVLRGIGML